VGTFDKISNNNNNNNISDNIITFRQFWQVLSRRQLPGSMETEIWFSPIDAHGLKIQGGG
jgi:hypothetical protein